MIKTLIPGFTLSLIDFSGEIDTVIFRLIDTKQRLVEEYSDLTFVLVGDSLELHGIKKSSE